MMIYNFSILSQEKMAAAVSDVLLDTILGKLTDSSFGFLLEILKSPVNLFTFVVLKINLILGQATASVFWMKYSEQGSNGVLHLGCYRYLRQEVLPHCLKTANHLHLYPLYPSGRKIIVSYLLGDTLYKIQSCLNKSNRNLKLKRPSYRSN